MAYITIDVHICKQRRTYRAHFPTGEMAVDFMRAREATHAYFTESDDPAVVEYLNPICEHGLSLHLCAGPMHYPADA